MKHIKSQCFIEAPASSKDKKQRIKRSFLFTRGSLRKTRIKARAYDIQLQSWWILNAQEEPSIQLKSIILPKLIENAHNTGIVLF